MPNAFAEAENASTLDTGAVLKKMKQTLDAEPVKPELKVMRIPTMIFVNEANNQDKPSVIEMHKLILDGFRPFAAYDGDLGHSIVFLFRG